MCQNNPTVLHCCPARYRPRFEHCARNNAEQCRRGKQGGSGAERGSAPSAWTKLLKASDEMCIHATACQCFSLLPNLDVAQYAVPTILDVLRCSIILNGCHRSDSLHVASEASVTSQQLQHKPATSHNLTDASALSCVSRGRMGPLCSVVQLQSTMRCLDDFDSAE